MCVYVCERDYVVCVFLQLGATSEERGILSLWKGFGTSHIIEQGR